MIIYKPLRGKTQIGWTSSRAWRHKPALEYVKRASLCHRGRKLIPFSHRAEHKLSPDWRLRSPRAGSLVQVQLPRAEIWFQINRSWVNGQQTVTDFIENSESVLSPPIAEWEPAERAGGQRHYMLQTYLSQLSQAMSSVVK